MFTSCVNSKIILSHRDDLKQPPCSLLKSGEGTKTNISICTNWQSGCVSNIDGKSWYLFSSSFFDFQTLELISQSLRPSQNPAKDPKRNSSALHLHARPTLKLLSFLPSWRSCAPRKSHLRLGGRTWYPDSNWSYTWTGQYWKNRMAQRAISSTPSLTSHAVNNQIRKIAASNHIKGLFTCLHLVSTPKSYSVTEMISNSLRAPYSNRGKEQRQTSRFAPIGNQAVSQTLMANHGISSLQVFSIFRP